jgi:hypothetical protein
MRTRNPQIDELAARSGIVFDQAMDFLARLPEMGMDGKPVPGKFGAWDTGRVQMVMDQFLATDAVTANTYNQPTLVTSPNASILAMLSTYIDPKLIEVLLSPLKAEEIYGVRKMGDWVTQTAAFGVIEMTGEASSYGDFNQSGRSDINVNWPQRQSYNFQTFTEWGDRELERYGLAKVDAAARKNLSSANTLNRLMNLIYFFGVPGLQNYGGLNDPSLAAALTPGTKVAGGTGWQNALPTEILADIQTMFASLQQGTHGTNGNLELTDTMTLGLHPVSEVYLANTNSFGLTAMEMIKKVFPNLKVVNAVQYLSGTTYSAQIIVDEIEGQRTMECAFNEKMRAHRIVPDTSSFRQKKSAGSWGTIVYRPIGVAEMSGL